MTEAVAAVVIALVMVLLARRALREPAPVPAVASPVAIGTRN